MYLPRYLRSQSYCDRAQENALAVYNSQNIISIQNKKTFGKHTDGLRIKYVNSKDDLYQEDTYLLMKEVNGKPLEIPMIASLKTSTLQEAADVITHGVHFTNIHKIRDMEMSLDEVIARMDDDQNRTNASIAISESEILLKVEDMEKELVGLIDIQAGAVQVIVEGGDASGRMSLLASQIDLTATQINMAAGNVVITGEQNKGQTIIEGGFLKTALIDVERLIAKKLLLILTKIHIKISRRDSTE